MSDHPLTEVCPLRSTNPLSEGPGTALPASWPLAAVPDSCPSVSACSPTSPCRIHLPPLPHPPSPLVSAAQNVPLPCLSSKDSLSLRLGNSRPGVRTLTPPNHPTIPLSTARASGPTVVVSLPTEIHLNPPLTFVDYPHRIASSDLLLLSPTSFTSPISLKRTEALETSTL